VAVKSKLEKLQKRISELGRSEAYFVALINNRAEAIWTIDSGYNFVIINDFFAKAYFAAYHIELKTGINALEILSPELARFWKDKYDTALNGENIIFKFSENIADEPHHYEVKLDPVFNGQKVVGVSAISSDITERKQVEEALLKTKDRLSKIILATNDGNWDWDLASNVVIFDNRYFEMAGYAVDEFPHRLEEFQSRVHLDDVDFVMDMAQRYLDGKINRFKAAFRFKKKNGEWLWIYGRGFIVERDKNGVPLRFVGTHTDITELKKTEEALKENMELFRTTLYSIGDAVITTDNDGGIMNINPVAEKLTGWKEEEVHGKSLEKIFHIVNELSGKTVENPVTKVLQEGMIVGLVNHTVLISKDGKKIPIADSGAPIKDEKGTVIGVVLVFRDQTKEREAKRKTEESLARLRRAEFVSKSGNWELHLTTKTIIASEGAGKIYGIDSEKMDYEFIKNVPFTEYRPLLDNTLKNLIEKGEPYDVEFKIKTFDTDETKDIHSIAFYDKERKVIFGLIQDITVRKHAEEEIKRNIERYKALISVSNTGAWEYHLSTDFLWCSPEYFSMLGRDVLDFDFSGKGNLKETWIDLLHPEDREMASHHFAEYLKTGSVGMYENYFRMKHNDGHWVWILSRGSTLRDENGNITNLTVGTHIDISERKLAEEKIAEQSRRLNNILEGTNVGTWDWNVQTGELLLNERWAEIMGYTLNELEPIDINTWIDNVHPDDLPVANAALEKLFEKETDYYDVEFRQPHKNGECVWVNARGKVVEWTEDGKPLQMSGTHLDITERKQAEQRLQNLNKELAAQNEEYLALNEELTESMERIQKMNIKLGKARDKAEESERLKTAFLHNMSHEMRTPMNGILGFSDLLKEPGLTGERQQEYIDIIKKSGHRMLNTIDDLMNIARIESGHEKPGLSEVNVNEQIEMLYVFFKPEAEKKGLQLRVNQPFPIHEIVIQTDKEKLYAILTNLVKNAIKYTPEGYVELGFVEKEDQLEFFVKDSGIGIPKSRQQAIFDRFVQADLEDRKVYEGIGLGLSISKSYVEMLGGKIGVESEEGVGSRFYFTISFKKRKKVKTNMGARKPEVKKIFQIKKLNVLIVEDEETADTYLTIVMKQNSKKVFHAQNGVEAVEICRKNPEVDLVLMDIKMPVMGGYEATVKIRKFNNNVVIIAQTAFGFSTDRKKAIEAGCNDYISKPINRNELMDIIGRYFPDN
jgi:PAS domain S-box-containing protein